MNAVVTQPVPGPRIPSVRPPERALVAFIELVLDVAGAGALMLVEAVVRMVWGDAER